MRKLIAAVFMLSAMVLLWLVFLQPKPKTVKSAGPGVAGRRVESKPTTIVDSDNLNDLLIPAEDIIRQVRDVTRNVVDKKASSRLALSYYHEASAFLTDTRVSIKHLHTAPEFQKTKTRADNLSQKIIAKIADLTYLIKADDESELKKSLVDLNNYLTSWRKLNKTADK